MKRKKSLQLGGGVCFWIVIGVTNIIIGTVLSLRLFLIEIYIILFRNNNRHSKADEELRCMVGRGECGSVGR